MDTYLGIGRTRVNYHNGLRSGLDMYLGIGRTKVNYHNGLRSGLDTYLGVGRTRAADVFCIVASVVGIDADFYSINPSIAEYVRKRPGN